MRSPLAPLGVSKARQYLFVSDPDPWGEVSETSHSHSRERPQI